MKFPIQWHENCLETMRDNYQRNREAVRRQQEDLERFGRDVFHYERQIHEAKQKGMDGFDSERFLKKQRDAAHGEKIKEG